MVKKLSLNKKKHRKRKGYYINPDSITERDFYINTGIQCPMCTCALRLIENNTAYCPNQLCNFITQIGEIILCQEENQLIN